MKVQMKICREALLSTIVGVLWGNERNGPHTGIVVIKEIVLRLCALLLIAVLSQGLSCTIG